MDKILQQYKNTLPFQIDYTSNFNRTFRRRFHKKYMDNFVSADEFGILVLLSENPQISQKNIAEILYKGKSHIGKILNEMQIKGLINREQQRDNSYINTITEKGMSIFTNGDNKVKEIIQTKIEQNFSKKEYELFITFLERYRNVLNSVIEVKLK